MRTHRSSTGRGVYRGVPMIKLNTLVDDRAVVIERLVRTCEGCEEADAVDLAIGEIRRDPTRSNLEIARAVAQRVVQS